jgi:hypothetical protein
MHGEGSAPQLGIGHVGRVNYVPKRWLRYRLIDHVSAPSAKVEADPVDPLQFFSERTVKKEELSKWFYNLNTPRRHDDLSRRIGIAARLLNGARPGALQSEATSDRVPSRS